MNNRIIKNGLKIDSDLYQLVTNDILPETGVTEEQVWLGLESIVNDLGGRNKALLKKRLQLQNQLDEWHLDNKDQKIDMAAYQAFLNDIGYLAPVDEETFSICPTNIDDEISKIAGPQLVVPVNNARFALNAANARWGSLYDALYGTNVVPYENDQKPTGFDPVRAKHVIHWASEFLDGAVPLKAGSHTQAAAYSLNDNTLYVELSDGTKTTLKEPEKFIGFSESGALLTLLLCNNGLHIELVANTARATSDAVLKDVIIESAISTIIDCEDSVTAVDAEDKVLVYRNWLGLMKGTLEESFDKGGKTITRALNEDRRYTKTNGESITLSGRSLLLVRNVGHLMTTDAVLDKDGNEIPEGFLDAVITTLCAMHDLKRNSRVQNSQKGSIYIVKPKMHGPEEATLTNDLFEQVEQALGLDLYTLKVGVMDEERRTSVNLKACIKAVKERLFFINTGFLDRTGDEIHTSMEAGAVLPKETIKEQPWITAYEDRNVNIGIECGLRGFAQIGKGMWPKPDEMLEMMDSKMAAPMSGANCAWVPSPTAATLHATHYHQVNVFEQQAILAEREPTNLEPLLNIPLLKDQTLTAEQIQFELDNNAQGILGYVVRWVEQGIGCSKVPNINDVGLMEDRATLRISSQHLANWIHHGICTEEQAQEALERMAVVVDKQNSTDADYKKMAPDFASSIAFQAACDLVFKGCEQPSGYTEPLLHARRREVKEQSK